MFGIVCVASSMIITVCSHSGLRHAPGCLAAPRGPLLCFSMAPKKRKAAAIQKEVKQPVQKRAGATTLQQDEADQFKTTTVRRQQKRNLDDKVERALGLHFKHMPRVVIEEMRVEGLTLREKIGNDMAEAEKHGGRLGTRYWQQAQQLYASSVDPTAVLEASDRAEPIAAPLIAALEHYDEPNPCLRTSEPLLAWLQTNPTVNQRELIGLLKACSKDPVRGKTNSDNVLLALLKFIARQGLQEKYTEEVKSILPLVDPILVRHFMTFKRSGVSVDTYLQCHMDVVCLLLDRSDLEAVLANKAGWPAVEPQLRRLSQSTQLGRALFTKSMAQLEASSYSNKVAGALEKLMGNITADTIDKYKATCMEAATVCKDKTLKSGKKIVQVSFCGHMLEVTTANTTHEWQLHLHAVLKQAALQSQQLVPLIYETWTIEPQWLAGGKQEVPMDTIQDYITARTLVAEMLDDKRLTTFAQMDQLIKANATNIMAVDRSFELELLMLSRAEPLLEVHVKGKILAILPTATQQRSIKQSKLEMEDLSRSDCCTKAGASVMSLVEGYIELLANMEKGICPNSDPAASSPFYAKALQACEWFCEFKLKGETGERSGQKSVYGMKAIQLHIKELAKKFADPASAGKVTLGDLEVLQTFKWKLSEKERKDLATWVKSVLSQGGGGAGHLSFMGQAASSSSVQKKGSTRSQPGAAPQAQAGVMKYF